jgi:hypothetical protein
MKIEFVASVLGSAAGATAILALFVKLTHFIQTKFGVGVVLKALFGKAAVGSRR